MKKEKYLQIFNYLLEFSKLRSNPVRNIENSEIYTDILWLANIPQNDIFDCIVFPNYNQDADYWLKIGKPKGEPLTPSFPIVNETLNEWINKEGLLDENGIPTLKETIIIKNKSYLLSDHPEVVNEFKAYINNQWLDDLEKYKEECREYEIRQAEYEKLAKIYKHLFSIYNKAQQFGEEYELIIGVGLLQFQEDDSKPLICRHILTSKAEIDFEYSQKESFVKVSPSIDNEIQIETDAIIDLMEQFDSEGIIDAEKKVVEFLSVKNITDNPFDNQIKDAIQLFADRLRPDGQSREDIAKPKEILKNPTVYYSPALILRKRNTRSFTALYQKIIDDINNTEDSIDIPSINDITGTTNSDSEFSDNPEFASKISNKDDIIYFPKKFNYEQIEIVEKAKRNNKVLVQGPPGTGKSHTIANLICHFLACGKKILVTAYTKRALEVLKDQLPADFRNLTVNLLSGDTTSLQDLDASVNAINDELSRNSNLDKYKKEINDREIELANTKEQIAENRNEWLKIKEKSTREIKINKAYEGTLLKIAEKIEKDSSFFNWYQDDFYDINDMAIVDDFERFISLHDFYKVVDCSVFDFIVPKKFKLITVNQLTDYYNINQQVLKFVDKEPISIFCSDYQQLLKKLQSLLRTIEEIEDNNCLLKSKLVANFQTNNTFWRDIISRTCSILKELSKEKLQHFDRSVEIIYPSNRSLKQLKNDAKALLIYLDEGNSLSGIVFNIKKTLLPKSIKEKLYFVDEVTVNGSHCDTKEEFETVLYDIAIKQDFEELNNIWEIKSNGEGKSYYERWMFYQHLYEDTEKLLSLLQNSANLKGQIETSSSVRINDLKSAEIASLIDAIDYNELLKQKEELCCKIGETIKHLSIQNIHPIAEKLKDAISKTEVENYERQLAEIDDIISENDKYKAFKTMKANLLVQFPILMNNVLGEEFDFSNSKHLKDAILHKQAVQEISKLLSKNYESVLISKISELEAKEERLISCIASKKAWLSILEQLNGNFFLRQHLQAWVQAVKKIGKTGKGKRALKFRKEAQIQMEKCKDSVPCWIMPLYKVAETVNPELGMYDYVIIDEASQLGADAIFLLYISKNIIIVGDDKQTSPEYIGVDANAMTPHINRHLRGIPFANFYGTEFSFFDHAKRFCKGMTVLREHFRCMPEIIEFSNKYFYAPDGIGLYPLKQYSENRLEPLKSVYCKNGYIDGTYQNITNRIEAEAIANTIAELIVDDNYFNKTMGVIGLQGNKQSMLIESSILKKIGEVEFKKRKIICGTSASFQGDERDIMFLSLITAENHKRTSLTRPEDERRFNVAVSRAKEQVWLFHSILLEDLSNTNDLRYKLLNHFLNYSPQPIPLQKNYKRTLGTQPEPFESWFEVDVYNDIIAKGYSVIPQYEVAKGRYRIDLVAVLSNGVKIAIECDGDKYHGAEQYENDLMRQKVLERCGWQFFRVTGAGYYTNRKEALEPLWAILSSNANSLEPNYLPEQQINNPSDKEKSIGDKQLIVNSSSSAIQDEEAAPVLFSHDEENKISIKQDKPHEPQIKIKSNLFSFSEILIFTSSQNVYKVRNQKFSELQQIASVIDFEEGEKPIYFAGTNNYMGFLIVAFENGKIGKISMSSFRTEHNREKLKNGYNNESKLVFIELIETDDDLVVLSNINKVVLFNTMKINPVESRVTKGVQVMKQKSGSFVKRVKKLNQVKLKEPEYYRKDDSLNVIGYYLKQGDEI